MAALSVGGQQHGMVCLDEDGAVVRDALLWNDVRSAGAAADLIRELGNGDDAAGRQAWADAVGLVPVASFTATKLRWLADAEPGNADRTAAVCLPHDWLTWQLSAATTWPPSSPTAATRAAPPTGRRAPASTASTCSSTRCAGAAPPCRASPGPRRSSGSLRGGSAVLGPGTGDNAAAALGLAARPGDVIVSIGTSGVVSAVSATPVSDPTGTVAGFADASGNHLPLVATMNAARVLDAAAALLGVDHQRLSDLALSAPVGGRRPGPGPLPRGRADAEPAAGHRLGARADAAHLHPGLLGPRRGRGAAVRPGRRHRGGRRAGRGRRAGAAHRRGAPGHRRSSSSPPAIFGRPVLVPPPGEYVADGAARQAAWALSGPTPPDWAQPGLQEFEPPAAGVRERYAEVRGRTDGQ